MFNLLGLPTEVIYRIIECTDPGDLESFSASYPSLEAVFRNALALQQRYSNLVLHGCHHGSFGSTQYQGIHPLDLLRQICKNPRVAWHTTSLTIESCGCQEEQEEEHEEEDLVEDEELEERLSRGALFDEWKEDAITVRKTMEDCAEDIEELVINSGYFNREGSERWYEHIRRGNRGAAFGLLLTLLPNLEVMKFRSYAWSARTFWEIVQRITEPRGRMSSKTHREGAKVLTKLREVELHGIGHEGTRGDIDRAGYFAKLPSMKRVCASRIKTHSPPYRGPWMDVGSRASNIEDISIRGGEWKAAPLRHCLASLKGLRRFHYDYSSDYELALYREGVTLVLEALLQHAKTSLESLNLYASNGCPSDDTQAIRMTLSGFEKLKNATLSCHLYAPVYNDDGEAEEEPHDTARNGVKPKRGNSGFRLVFKVTKLVDILPRSMEVIEFWGEVAMEHVQAMLQGLVEHRTDRLPHLEVIVFHQAADIVSDAALETAKELEKQCRGIGVQLVLGDRFRRN